jgi:tRNA(Ile)-lysidine synthetase-like protein
VPSSPPDLADRVRASVASNARLSAGETVLVAVSGGPDSVALLDALARLAPQLAIRLAVGHLDHRLRPRAAEDAAAVARLAASLGLPAHVAARDVGAYAAEAGRGLEDAARRLRYAYLAAVAAEIGASAVALGHTADDQAETVLMNFLRGSGLAGLKGMTPTADYPLSAPEIRALEPVGPEAPTAARAAPVAPAVPWPPRLVRPLLGVTRAEVEAYLRTRDLEARRDPSNVDRRFLRNRVRHDILPALEEVNPRLREALVRNAALIADDLAFLDAAVDVAWREVYRSAPAGTALLDRTAWSALHPALQRGVLRRAAEMVGADQRELGAGPIETARTLALEGSAGRTTTLPGGFRLEVEQDTLRLHPEVPVHAEAPQPSLPLPSDEAQPLGLPGETRLPGGWSIRAEVQTHRASEALPRTGPWTAYLDADRIGPRLTVRARRPGDRMQPLGMGGRHKSLQDLFVDRRVPRAERDAWPVIVAGDEIVWVPGLRQAEVGRVGPSTRRLVILHAAAPEWVRG